MEPNFSKSPNGLLPAIVQDAKTKTVLMLGYMNAAAYRQTLDTQKVTFYSRSKERLWTKGEESGHVLELVECKLDCDCDSFLITAHPKGPTCHKGTATCWGEDNFSNYGFLTALETTIAERKESDAEKSYIASLFRAGLNKIAQKVGEEAVETVIEAKDNQDDLFLNESADLLFHYLILLHAKGFALNDVVKILENRKQ
ncbi:MAG: bifunctional phosphoribosyl-AMP cyclohydrolase/phosphoribosyl-ATP diphosphatase HisIE [Flavobacteriaceae bacterium]